MLVEFRMGPEPDAACEGVADRGRKYFLMVLTFPS